MSKGLKNLMSELGDPTLMTSELFDLTGQNEKYDDRAAAIVYAAFVESALETAITEHFVASDKGWAHLFSYSRGGPIANFAAKIMMGEALGIYDEKMRKDLDVIRNVRNVFAHAQTKVTFDTEAVRVACDGFYSKFTGIALGSQPGVDVNNPRGRYTVNATKIHFYLTMSEPKPIRFSNNSHYGNLYLGEPPPGLPPGS